MSALLRAFLCVAALLLGPLVTKVPGVGGWQKYNMPDANVIMRLGACFCCSAVDRCCMSAIVGIRRKDARGGTTLVAGVVRVAANEGVMSLRCWWHSSRVRCCLE